MYIQTPRGFIFVIEILLGFYLYQLCRFNILNSHNLIYCLQKCPSDQIETFWKLSSFNKDLSVVLVVCLESLSY